MLQTFLLPQVTATKLKLITPVEPQNFRDTAASECRYPSFEVSPQPCCTPEETRPHS